MWNQNMEYWIIQWFDYNLKKIWLKQLLYDVTWYDMIRWKQSHALTLPRLTVDIQHLQHKLVIYHWRKVSSREEVTKTTDRNGSDEKAHKSIMKVIKWLWTGIYCLLEAILVTSDL